MFETSNSCFIVAVQCATITFSQRFSDCERSWRFVDFRFLLFLLHIRTQRSRTVTWRGKEDGHNGAHIDAGADTAALRAKLAVSGKEVRLVRQFEDGTYLVVAKSGKGLTFLEPDRVFKWTGHVNTDSDIEGLVVQVPTGRCGGSKFSADPTMKNALLHKSVKKFDVSLLYGVPSLFLSAKHIALWPSRHQNVQVIGTLCS